MSTATDMLAKYLAAEAAILTGQTVRWGERLLTRADLAEVRKGRQEWETKTAAQAGASATHRGPRHLLADFSRAD